MASCKTVSFNTNQDVIESQLESVARWLSCNGEIWGIGPTAVFACAATVFLYHQLETTVFVTGDNVNIGPLEKSLVSMMVLGMLALMIHLWVCAMRFFQYYLDTLIRDSPSVLLEMTTAGLLGDKTELVPIGPLTRFLKQQQPQIHITICWFLSLCYADYVRKNYCHRFNLPYLEQWQSELHERATRSVNKTMKRVNSFVGTVHQRLRGFVPSQTDAHTGSDTPARPDCTGNPWRCDSVLGHKDGTEFCMRLETKPSPTADDEMEKLRNFINATRCSCSGPQMPGVSHASDLNPEDEPTGGRTTNTRQQLNQSEYSNIGAPTKKLFDDNIAENTNPEPSPRLIRKRDIQNYICEPLPITLSSPVKELETVASVKTVSQISLSLAGTERSDINEPNNAIIDLNSENLPREITFAEFDKQDNFNTDINDPNNCVDPNCGNLPKEVTFENWDKPEILNTSKPSEPELPENNNFDNPGRIFRCLAPPIIEPIELPGPSISAASTANTESEKGDKDNCKS